MTRLAIHLLGPPWIAVERETAPGPRGRKAWGLLAFLLLTARPVSRERLAGLLFADADDPLAALRWNLAELRRSLGPEVRLGGDPVELELSDDVFVDVLALMSAGSLDAARELGLGHELLEGVAIQASAAFEAWLLVERRHIAGLSAAVLRDVATDRLAAGAPNAAVELATSVIAIDEFDEEAHALLIRAYVMTGAVAQARQHLESTVERFRRELGVEPSATLRTAIETAVASAPAVAPWVESSAAIESLIAAGEAAVGAGVFEAGLDILRRSTASAHQSGDRRLEARALVALGTAFVHAGRGRSSEGATALHAGLRLADQIADAALVTEATRELGYIELKEAHYDLAAAWLDRAIEIAPDLESRVAAAAIRGAVLVDQGATDPGIELLARAATDARLLDRPRSEAWALAFLGRTQLLREDLDSAGSSLTRALDVARAAGWMTFLPFPQALLATVDLAAGRVEEAGGAFEAAFALGCQIGDPCWEGLAARGIGLVHRAHGRIAEAIAWLDDARTRCMRIADAYLWMQAYCLDALCEVAIESGDARAAEWISVLETVAAQTGMDELLVRAELHRVALGDPRAAAAARLFADRIDNPAVLRRVAAMPEAAWLSVPPAGRSVAVAARPQPAVDLSRPAPASASTR